EFRRVLFRSLSALRLGGFRSHRRERNVHAVHGQRTTQLERIGPHTTDGVRSHEHVHAPYASSMSRAPARMPSVPSPNEESTRRRSIHADSAPGPQSSSDFPSNS